jgi:hypothetical protein
MWTGNKYESATLKAEVAKSPTGFYLEFKTKLEQGKIFLRAKTEADAIEEAKEKLKQRFEL